MSLVRALAHGERAVAGRGCARESRKPPQSLICSLRTLTLLKTFLPKGVHITSYYNVIVFSCFFLPRMLRLIGNDRFFSRHLYISLPLQQRRLEDEWRCSALSYFRQVSPPKSWPGVALSLSEPVRNQRARILPGFGLASTLASTAAAELAAACFFQPVL